MITKDAWLAALDAAQMLPPDDPDAITIAEFAALVGVKRVAAQRRLDQLVSKGLATPTRRWVDTGWGRRSVLAYGLVASAAPVARSPKPARRSARAGARSRR